MNIDLKYIYILFSCIKGFYGIFEVIYQILRILRYLIHETVLKFFIGLLTHSLLLIILGTLYLSKSDAGIDRDES